MIECILITKMHEYLKYLVQLQRKLIPEKGCKVSTEQHEFQSGFDLDVEDEIQRWPTIWNISDALFDVNAATLREVVQRLKLIDSRPTTIRDIKKMVWMDTHSKINLGISILLKVISVVIISGVSYLIYRYFKIKQQQVQNNVNIPA